MNTKMIETAFQEYTAQVAECVKKTDCAQMTRIAQIMIEAKKRGTTIFTAGNGGSAATASHICNDLLKGCSVCGNPGFKSACLCDSAAVMTCLANDFDYTQIYSIQLATKGNAGDVLLVYSGSGNSANVLKAVEVAHEKNMTVIGFTGRDGGKLAPMCDEAVIAPTDSMEQIEDLHMMYAHALSAVIQQILAVDPV